MSTITINLNGGDLVTPDVDLTYKIYGGLDGFTTPIQTYGSANTDANVSVSSGVATLLNANLNGESEVKVTTTDQAGNESFKSNAYSVPVNPFADATLAFSLRDLGLGNVTSVVRVRRSSDNTEQDFTPTEVTDGTLTTFCGVGDGFVSIWYDQSSNSNNGVQTTLTEQHQIVSSGALFNVNGLPGVDAAFKNGYSITQANVTSAFTVTKLNFLGTSTNQNRILTRGSSSTNSFFLGPEIGIDGQTVVDTSDLNQNLVVFDIVSNEGIITKNNSADENIGVVSASPITPNEIFGRPGRQLRAYYQELICFDSDISSIKASGVTNINDYYSIY